MTYTAKLQNAKTGWVIENIETPDLATALRLKSKWFREFHEVDEVDLDRLRPTKIHLPVCVTIASS